MLLVGLDCATQPQNTGLARATLEEGRVRVLEARIGRTAEGIVDTLVGWLSESPRAVFALDAPLGWPLPMGALLAAHQAGGPLAPEASGPGQTPADQMFNRETDRIVRRMLGKKPLEVGADRIARTALTALATLEAVGHRVEVEMGWTPGAVASGEAPSRHVLEVYPAATLLARGLPTRGYKASEAHDLRARLVDALDADLEPEPRAAAIATDHGLDAVLCCLAAADYARGDVLTPEAAGVSDERARREGWIWFEPPGP
ncbi:MAG: DUF429 domain-containing protein [Bacteroidota bacterium]